MKVTPVNPFYFHSYTMVIIRMIIQGNTIKIWDYIYIFKILPLNLKKITQYDS